MAGYATLGRVQGGRVRTLAWRPPVPEHGDDASWSRDAGRGAMSARPRRPLREVIPERWDDLRDQWAMTTFYLFDPESWR